MRKLFGVMAMLMAVAVAYVWSKGTWEDRHIAIMIAILGLAATFAIDIPSLIQQRKRK